MDDLEGIRHRIRAADLPAIAEFFTEPGAVEVIAMLDPSGYRLNELDDELDVSRPYISERLLLANNHGLVTREKVPDDEPGEIQHRLTPLGEWVKRYMDQTGLLDTHDALRETRARFQAQKADFTDWVADTEAVKAYLDDQLTDAIPDNYHDEYDHRGRF